MACNLVGVDQATCVQGCASAVAAYGAAGQAVAAGCANCLTSSTCAQISSGSCASACPDALFGGSPDGGTSCQQQWMQPDRTYLVRCQWDSSSVPPDYSCNCYLDGVQGDIFDSANFCSLSLPDQTKQANTGCGWQL